MNQFRNFIDWLSTPGGRALLSMAADALEGRVLVDDTTEEEKEFLRAVIAGTKKYNEKNRERVRAILSKIVFN